MDFHVFIWHLTIFIYLRDAYLCSSVKSQILGTKDTHFVKNIPALKQFRFQRGMRQMNNKKSDHFVYNEQSAHKGGNKQSRLEVSEPFERVEI